MKIRSNLDLVFSQPLLPSPFTNDDVNQLLLQCLKGTRKTNAEIFSDGIVVSRQFIDKCKKIFEPLMKEKAELVSCLSNLFVYFRCLFILIVFIA